MNWLAGAVIGGIVGGIMCVILRNRPRAFLVVMLLAVAFAVFMFSQTSGHVSENSVSVPTATATQVVMWIIQENDGSGWKDIKEIDDELQGVILMSSYQASLNGSEYRMVKDD